MKSASLTYGAGPGSTITLTAETIRVRDTIIEKFADASLSELNSFIETALGAEKDENKRLGILAARVYILRMRMQNISSFNRDPSQQTLNELTPADMLKSEVAVQDDASGEAADGATSEQDYQEWNELTITESGEINGVRIPKGVTITVGIEDAKRLIETHKAVFAKTMSDDAHASQADESGENTPASQTDIPANETSGSQDTDNMGGDILASDTEITDAKDIIIEGDDTARSDAPISDSDEGKADDGPEPQKQ